MEEQNVQSSETIKMVERAMTVLELLRTSKEKLGVNEIAKICTLTPSTAFRILKTLEKSGWVFQFSDGRYIAGQKLSFMVEKNNLYLALKEVSSFVMDSYTQKYSQAMNLMVRDGSRCYILQQSRTKKLIDYVPQLHSYLPFYACAGGKILLSELPISLVDNILASCELEPLTANTITDPEKFWQELRLVAAHGYAYDNKESSDFACCISVPVRDCEDNIIAALSFSGFIGIDDPNSLLKYVPILKDAALEISQSLYRCWNM